MEGLGVGSLGMLQSLPESIQTHHQNRTVRSGFALTYPPSRRPQAPSTLAPRPQALELHRMLARAPRLLVADDQPDVLEALKLLLKGEGFDVETAASPRAVLAAVEARDFDALLVDMNYARDTTSGAEGLDLLSRVQGLESAPPVVVMTAWASIDGAVEAMRRGARDYVEKPWDNRRLLATMRTQVELGRALRKSQRLEIENRTLRREGLPELIAESPAMEPVLRLMERVGPSDANVLILGEHGTGKEVVARWRRADVRVVGATNADIQAEVKSGRFREDLLFRLNTGETRLPPLRERRADVPLLAAHFLRRYAARYRKAAKEFAPDAMEQLLRHSWPGNVRELDHAVERAVLMAEGGRVQARDFGLGGSGDGAGAAALDQMSLENVERVLIQKALTRSAGNVSDAAKALGLSRSALYRRLKRHGL